MNRYILAIWRLLDFKQKRKYWILLGVSIASTLLDLLGIYLVFILISVSKDIPFARDFMEFTKIILEQIFSFSVDNIKIIITLISVASIFFILKSCISIFLLRKTSLFLAGESAKLSEKYLASIISKNDETRRFLKNSQIVYTLAEGCNKAIIGVLGSIMQIACDVLTLGLLVVALCIFNPLFTMIVCGYLIVAYMLLERFTSKKAKKYGAIKSTIDSQIGNDVHQFLNNFKELYVRNKEYFYAQMIAKKLNQSVNAVGELWFIPHVSKYVIETFLILGTLFLSLYLSILSSSEDVVQGILFFLIAGSRILPSILRIQQNSFYLKTSISQSQLFFDDVTLESLMEIESLSLPIIEFDEKAMNDVPIQVSGLTFQFDQTSEPVLSEINFVMNKNSFVGITGASGVGKSTFVELLVGLLRPTKGSIEIFGLSPSEIRAQDKVIISYVPQSTYLSNLTIREAIAFGFDDSDIDNDKVKEVLEKVGLMGIVDKMPKNIFSETGNLIGNMSGGQRQRLSIARAIYTTPKLLIVDEAFSAIDSSGESEMVELLRSLQSELAILSVFHRSALNSAVDELYKIHNRKLLRIR